MKIQTKCIHDNFKQKKQYGEVVSPIYLTTTFKQKEPGIPFNKYEYSRSGNPTRDELETCIANLENSAYGISFSSGLATINAVLKIIEKDKILLSVLDIYGGTKRLFSKLHNNIKVKYIKNFTSINFFDKNIGMVWIESPTNPKLQVYDIKKICDSFPQNVIKVVDNTFMTPIFQQPLKLGADIVVHSITKYINGHCDVLMGIAVTSNQIIAKKLQFIQYAVGAVPSPFDCYLVLRGIKTLYIRMKKHQENALKVALFLEKHPKIKRVYYPGLQSHPEYNITIKQCMGFSGMICCIIDCNPIKFLKKLKLFTIAESLGSVKSLIEIPALMTHTSISEKDRNNLGINNNLIRLSIGIEDIEDIINDLNNALS